MYGVNAAGNSCCAYVHGFEPYFYIERRAHWSNDHLQALGDALNVGRGACVFIQCHTDRTTVRNYICMRVHVGEAALGRPGRRSEPLEDAVSTGRGEARQVAALHLY